MITHQGTVELTTPRLRLVRFETSFAEDMFRNYGSDPKTTRFLLWDTHADANASRAVLEKWVPQYVNADYYNWAIFFEDTLVGGINLHGLSERDSRCELGYAIGSRWWNRGVVTEAARAVRDFAFERLNMNKLAAGHDTENPASGRVMQKIGMVREGTARQHFIRRDGTYGDMASYGMTREDWEKAQFSENTCVFTGHVSLPASDGELSLRVARAHDAIPEKHYVPAYDFDVMLGDTRVGEINLRAGYQESLYYGGNIGYNIDEAYRGRGYAGRACRLLVPYLKAHGMRRAIITNEESNAASRRVCEKLGLRHLRLAKLPETQELYQMGQRAVNVYLWEIE